MAARTALFHSLSFASFSPWISSKDLRKQTMGKGTFARTEQKSEPSLQYVLRLLDVTANEG